MGAHPAGSSRITSGGEQIPLREYIRQNPARALGRAATRFGNELPFLLKVLAAEQPLSIQAHPSAEQARQGFERENQAGIPMDSPLRNYRDPNHKPEMICALTPFLAMCGFRPYAEVAGNFRKCGLSPYFSGLGKLDDNPASHVFQRFILQVLSLGGKNKRDVLEALDDSLQKGSEGNEGIRRAYQFLKAHYPDDPGLLAPLFLNIFNLQPGEALYLGAGVMHAYLEGSGIEVMANSDNVLRGGLTQKHIDLDELARVLDFSPYESGKFRPGKGFEDSYAYPVFASEFNLRRMDLMPGSPVLISTEGLPIILLSETDSLMVSWDDSAISIGRGGSAFVGADTESFSLSGEGRVWLASVPDIQN